MARGSQKLATVHSLSLTARLAAVSSESLIGGGRSPPLARPSPLGHTKRQSSECGNRRPEARDNQESSRRKRRRSTRLGQETGNQQVCLCLSFPLKWLPSTAATCGHVIESDGRRCRPRRQNVWCAPKPTRRLPCCGLDNHFSKGKAYTNLWCHLFLFFVFCLVEFPIAILSP